MLIPRIAACAILAGSGALFAQNGLTCSSDDGKRHYCDADTRDGVRMSRQRSDAACTQGYSWGYDRRGIWVDHGCRADFIVGGGSYDGRSDDRYRHDRDDRDRDDHDRDRDRDRGDSAYGDSHSDHGGATLTCSSDDGKRHYCDTDTRGGVRLLRQRSESACREGKSWGYDRRGVWVDHGCRADFEVGR